MNTNRNNLIIPCVVCVLITFASVHCNKNENDKLPEPIFGKAQSYWFVKTEDANVTVSDISQNQTVSPARSEDIFLNTAELAIKYGYKAKVHFPTTDDGYKLTLFQIVGKGPVVFLMHDIFGSSDDFVVSGPGKALAFKLADEDYNVWLGNARGNKYSRDHKFLDPDSKSFWEFSWHEIGCYDLPALVEHALMDSQCNDLTYIGHGQGTTAFFVLTSEKPEFNEKFNLMISLGTLAWIWHIESPFFRSLVKIPDSEFQSLERHGNYEIFPASKSSKSCCKSTEAELACITALFDVVGYDYDQIDFDTACLKLTHYPSGSSLRQLQHYVQLIRSREFANFDFGKDKNMVKYGSPIPPRYEVGNINTTIVIFYGDNDWISSLDDTIILVQRLPNVDNVYRVPHYLFNHLDFVFGKDSDQLLYWEIINIIEQN